jgi:hypothetical protein
MFFGSLASLVAAYFLGRQLIKSRILLAFFCWFIASACVIPFWMSKWGGVRCLAMVAPALFLFRALKSGGIPAFIWFGVSSGICFLITQEAGVIAIVMFMAYIWQVQGKRPSDIAAFFLPFLSIVGAFYLYLILRGASMEMVLLNTLKSPLAFFNYYNNPPRIALLPFLRPFHVSVDAWLACLQSASFDFVFSALLYAVSVVYLFINRKKQEAGFLLMMVFGIAMFMIGMRGFTGPVVSGPQFRWALLGTGLTGFYFIQKLIFPVKKKGEGARALALKSFCLLLLFLGLIFSKLTPDYMFYMSERYKDIGLPAVLGPGLERLGDARLPQEQAEIISKATQWIQANTGKDEPIYAFPHEPQYYFLAERRCADIFTNAIDSGISDKLQKETVARLTKSGLRYAIMVQDSYRVMGNRQIPNKERIPLVYDYFSGNFSQAAAFGKTLVLKRK